MLQFKTFILPCAYKDFVEQIATDQKFTLVPRNKYLHQPNLMIEGGGFNNPLRNTYCNEDGNVIVYDYLTTLVIQAKDLTLKKFWILQAALLEVNSKISLSDSRCFYVPFYLMGDFLKYTPIRKTAEVEYYFFRCETVSILRYLDGNHCSGDYNIASFKDGSDLSRDEFLALNPRKLGTCETYRFYNGDFTLYNRELAMFQLSDKWFDKNCKSYWKYSNSGVRCRKVSNFQGNAQQIAKWFQKTLSMELQKLKGG